MEPDDPLVLFGLASEYLKLQRYEEAIKTARHLISVQPDYSAAHKILGRLLPVMATPMPPSIPTKQESESPKQKGISKPKKKWKYSSTASNSGKFLSTKRQRVFVVAFSEKKGGQQVPALSAEYLLVRLGWLLLLRLVRFCFLRRTLLVRLLHLFSRRFFVCFRANSTLDLDDEDCSLIVVFSRS